jgi:site-specific DNA-cytosine methylase
LKVKKPNVLFLLENVRMESKCKKAIDDMLGVEGVLINSNLFSAQNRQRYYWTNIPIAELPSSSSVMLKDIVRDEDNVNSRLPISKIHHSAWLEHYKWKSDDIEGKSKPLLASYYKQPPHCPYIQYREVRENEDEIKDSIYRRLSPIECERLQTLPDNYTLVVNEKGKENSYMQRYKMLGNGWTVEVIRHIFSSLKEEI